MARSATTYALRKAGYNVVSPPYGYTNELGIVLAALGIESLRLFSFRGLAQVLTARPPQDAYVCVEVGADWYPDIPWFVKRFAPWGVCVTDVAAEEWTRPHSVIWNEKRELVRHIVPDGFLCYSKNNTSVNMLRSFEISSQQRKEFTPEAGDLMPYAEAFGCALACLQVINKDFLFKESFFADYKPVTERLSLSSLRSGATLIADTYKAIPQCTEYILGLALSLPAKHKVAVISEMRPLWRNKREHYGHLASLLQSFDTVYFIGPVEIEGLLRELLPDLQVIQSESEYSEIAESILVHSGSDSVVVVKGAGRYHLAQMVSKLKS
jgi:UDP-N-acetylmuramyl pentapeptide synthase